MDYVVNTKKFHSVIFNKFYKKKIEPKEILYYYLFSAYLDYGCEKYPSEEALFNSKSDLYDLSFSVKITSFGLEMLYEFVLDALDPMVLNDECYTLDILEEAFNDYMRPVIVKNTFSKTIFNKVKKRTECELKSRLSNFDVLASDDFNKTLLNGSLLAYTTKDMLKDLETVTNDELYNYYKRLISCESTTVFVGSSYNKPHDDSIKLTPYLSLSDRPNPNCDLLCIKKAPSKQAYVTMFYDLNICRNDVRIMDILMLDYILGSSSYSKLFEIVREKYGLAYSISSHYHHNKEGLEIRATIDKRNLDLFISKVNETFLHLFDNIDINNVRRVLLNDEYLVLDSITSYSYDVVNTKTIKNRVTKEERINRLKAITIDDLRKLADSMKLKLIHVYGGDLND